MRSSSLPMGPEHIGMLAQVCTGRLAFVMGQGLGVHGCPDGDGNSPSQGGWAEDL